MAATEQDNKSDSATDKADFIDEMFAELDEEERTMPRWRKLYRVAYRKAEALRQIPRSLRWSLQRARRGYSDSDTWGFDHYLSEMIPAAVEQIRKNAHGHPSGICSTCPDTWEHGDNCDGVGRWDETLAAIADGFRAAHEPEQDWSKVKSAKDLVHETPEEIEARKARFDKGMALFAEYYTALWD